MSSRRIVCAALLSISAGTIVIIPAPATIPTRSPLSLPLLQGPTPAVAGGSPAFDVVSVQRNLEPGTNYPLSPPIGGRLARRNQTVRGLISNSYGVQDYQLTGGPNWLRTDARVEATPPPPAKQMLLRIIGQRNALAHEYGAINQERVWLVASGRIPELIHLLEPAASAAARVTHSSAV